MNPVIIVDQLRRIEFEDLVRNMNEAKKAANEIGTPVVLLRWKSAFGTQHTWEYWDGAEHPSWDIVKIIEPEKPR